jgi:hypothetical protein
MKVLTVILFFISAASAQSINGTFPFPQPSPPMYEAWPIIDRFESGSVFIVYNHGTDDGTTDSVIRFRKAATITGTWSAATTIASEVNTGSNLGAGGMMTANRAEICYSRAIGIGAGGLSMNCVYSDNEGVSWTGGVTIPKGSETGYTIPFSAIITVDEGRHMLSWYGVTNGVHTAYISTSGDNGVTWGAPTAIASGYNECSLEYLWGSGIVAICRAVSGVSHQFISVDNGASWDDQGEVNFPQPDNGVPFSQVAGKPIFVTGFKGEDDQRYVAAYFFNPGIPVQLYVSYGRVKQVAKGPDNWLLTKWIYAPANDGFGSTGHYPHAFHTGPAAFGAHNYFHGGGSPYSDVMLFQMAAPDMPQPCCTICL